MALTLDRGAHLAPLLAGLCWGVSWECRTLLHGLLAAGHSVLGLCWHASCSSI